MKYSTFFCVLAAYGIASVSTNATAAGVEMRGFAANMILGMRECLQPAKYSQVTVLKKYLPLN